MWKMLAVVAISPLVVVLPVPAHAEPGGAVDPGANYQVFLRMIAEDGIEMDGDQAIQEGYGVCALMRPPNDLALWDAGQHVLTTHPDWSVGQALSFSTRSVQDICPHNGSF
ncbi:DUF732 domain-containing protein [Mycolicibacterium neoaurum]|uniref:DUF732 domain-containing protein n=1 Tax=Mycolicibacterium neoaurum TaxID=1795 RepID=UPI002671927B|nr:DUF732 domain-containing protein [Mycolicibacterium neoaurum]MDO3402721.1 DUF732 domain-containing protein [Mycolicibacterium neoaurum]